MSLPCVGRCLIVLALLTAPARARRPPARSRSPDGRVAAVTVDRGGDSVVIDGERVWHGRASVTTPLRWSRAGDALAFVAQGRAGTELVVLLVEDAPVTLSWPLPRALSARVVTWLGPARVGVGPKELDPRVVASWTADR